MSKGIIIYQSKYGSTKKYVQWLQEATGFDTAEVKKAKADTIKVIIQLFCAARSMLRGLPEYLISERIKRTCRQTDSGILCRGFTI